MSEQNDPMQKYREILAGLVAKRDAKNAEVEPLKVKLDAANARAQEAQNEANALSAEIQKVRGGQSWLSLKKEIGKLSAMVSGKQ